MFISKFAAKKYYDLTILILKFVLKNLTLKFFVINGLNFYYIKYTNVNKIV